MKSRDSTSGVWLPDIIAMDHYGYVHGKNPEQGLPDPSFFVIVRYKAGQTDRSRLQGTTVSILLSGMWAAVGTEAKFSFVCMCFCPSKGTDEILHVWTGRWVLSEKTRL